MPVEFAVLTKEECKYVDAIIRRAQDTLKEIDALDLEMDLTAVHKTNPLDLKALSEFPAFDFAHDIYGIMHHLDRKTGQLTRFFSPRCTRREHA